MTERRPALSRRQILSGSVAAASVLAADGCTRLNARTISGEVPWVPGQANAPSVAPEGPLRFLTSDEAAFLDAAVSRLIPADDLGPGAKEAGVTVFIDRQLAGPYGKAAHWYMQGPWEKGQKTQGYQSRLTPAELYRAAIKAIDTHVRKKFGDRTFIQLSAGDQDSVLTELEKGTIDLDGADAKTFFDVFLQNTTEGFFSDPIYGGNRDMVGWKLIGFPGARYNYLPYVGKHGQKLDLPPVGLKGRPDWHPES